MEQYSNTVNPNASPERPPCQSCGAKMKGEFCRKCGEKRIVPEKDLSFSRFLRISLFHLAHFDSKLLKSFWLLFSKPGFLAREWTNGRRVLYMKPFQMFVIAGLLFYLFLPTAVAHFSSFTEMEIGFNRRLFLSNTFHYDIKTISNEKATALGTTVSSLENQLRGTAANRSKALLFVFIPLLGLVIFVCYRNQMPWAAPHLILATHSMAVYILVDLLIHAIDWILGLHLTGSQIYSLLMSCFAIYLFLSFKRAYNEGWAVTLLKSGIIWFFFIFCLRVYRQLIIIWVLCNT